MKSAHLSVCVCMTVCVLCMHRNVCVGMLVHVCALRMCCVSTLTLALTQGLLAPLRPVYPLARASGSGIFVGKNEVHGEQRGLCPVVVTATPEPGTSCQPRLVPLSSIALKHRIPTVSVVAGGDPGSQCVRTDRGSQEPRQDLGFIFTPFAALTLPAMGASGFLCLRGQWR